MRIAVVSDTHGSLDGRVFERLEGVERILHCGDVGTGGVLEELKTIAPVEWVRGNCDLHVGPEIPDCIVGDFPSGWRYLMTHVLGDPRRIRPAVQLRLHRDRPNLVFFGHSHRPELTSWQGRHFLNPGAIYRPRGSFEASIALLDLGEERLVARIVDLDGVEIMRACWIQPDRALTCAGEAGAGEAGAGEAGAGEAGAGEAGAGEAGAGEAGAGEDGVE